MKKTIKTFSKSSILKVILLIFFISTYFSCKDDFLERKPLSEITNGSYFTKNEHAVYVVNAVYDVLQWEFDEEYGGWIFPSLWQLGDCVSDDSEPGGSNLSDAQEILDISSFKKNTSNAKIFYGIWKNNYSGIARANFAINNIEKMQIDDKEFTEKKNRYIAEAKFLRAHFYFNLVKVFGGVVKITNLLSPSEYNTPRSSAEEIWALIEEDLLFAAKNLPKKSQYNASLEMGRATQGAAYSMLAKAYLYQSKWQNAKETTEIVINSGEYSLATNYLEIFRTAGEHGSGSVFEINFSSKYSAGWPPNYGDGSSVHTFEKSRGDQGGDKLYTGWGWHIPTQNLYDAFEPNDARREATLLQTNDVLEDGSVVINHNYVGKAQKFTSGKHRLLTSEIPPSGEGDPFYNGPQNVRIIRYADVLLLHAEASAKVGDEAAAKISLNKVRARARNYAILKKPELANDPTLLPDVTSTGNELLEAIWKERRVELGMEGHRFFDLARQKRAGTVLRKYPVTTFKDPANFTDGVNEIFPIPLRVIEQTNGAITQNQGYN